MLVIILVTPSEYVGLMLVTTSENVSHNVCHTLQKIIDTMLVKSPKMIATILVTTSKNVSHIASHAL